MRRLLSLSFVALAACTVKQQEADSAAKYQAWLHEGRDDQPESVEWQYALKDFQGDREGECAMIHQSLQQERNCQGEVCRHAVVLGRDWLRLCKAQVDPSVRASVEEQVARLRERERQPPTKCSSRAEAWISDGCGNDGACLPAAREWATSCAAQVASPLTLTMLEQKIETSYATPHRVALDTRDCDALGEAMKRAAKCKRKFDCEDELPKLRAYQSKCVPPGGAMPPGLALAALKLLFVADQGNEVPVAAEPEGISREDAPLALADGSGAIVQICKERPTSVENYLLAAKGCDEYVLAARFFPGQPHRVLRAAWVPHPDVATFANWYPSLAVTGMPERRDTELLQRFEQEILGAAQLAENHPKAPEPIGKLLQALSSLPVRLLDSAEVQRALAGQDARFTEAFEELGRQKTQAPRPTSPPDLVAYVRRSENLPLADLKLSGEVEVGAQVAGGTVRLRRYMPAAFEAYFERVKHLGQTIQLRAAELEELENRVVKAAVTCKSVQDERQAATEGLLRCAFSRDACAQKATTAWAGSLIDIETRTKGSWTATELAIWSLPVEKRGEAQTAASQVCRTP